MDCAAPATPVSPGSKPASSKPLNPNLCPKNRVRYKECIGAECLRNENPEAAMGMGIEMRCVGQHLKRDFGIVDERPDGRQMCCRPESRREMNDREGEGTVEGID